MSKAYLSLGSNMGDRVQLLENAMKSIDELDEVSISAKSKIYETPPWGYENQASFLNLCLEVETALSPFALLEKLQEIEHNLHRERKIHWGPRTIDIDILLFDDIISVDPRLIIPHPRMTERAFVIVPLMDINSELLIQGKKIVDIMSTLDTTQIKEFID